MNVKTISMGSYFKVILKDDVVKSVIINDVKYDVIPKDSITQSEDERFCYVYVIIHIPSKRYYIGRQFCKDKYRFMAYKGSGTVIKHIVEKYGNDVILYPIVQCHSVKETAMVEAELITESMIREHDYCLNRCLGGLGCDSSLYKSEEEKKKIIAKRIRSMKEFYKKHPEVLLKRNETIHRKYQEDSSLSETRSKMSKNRMIEYPDLYGKFMQASENYWNDKLNCEKQSIKQKEIWQNDEYHNMMIEKRKKRFESLESHIEQSVNAKRGWAGKDEQQREKDIERLKSLWNDENRHKKQSIAISDKFKNNEWKTVWKGKLMSVVKTNEWILKNKIHLSEIKRKQMEQRKDKLNKTIFKALDSHGNVVFKAVGFYNMKNELQKIKAISSDIDDNILLNGIVRAFRRHRQSRGFQWTIMYP